MAERSRGRGQERSQGRGRDTAPGRQKQHTVVNPDGTVGVMTQDEWQNRDKDAGYRRVEEGEDIVPPETILETPAAPEEVPSEAAEESAPA